MKTDRKTLLGTGFLAAYIGAIVLANWLIVHVGFVRTWPLGFMAPAGVYAAGITFPARDTVQRLLGPWAGLTAIAAGALLSYFISPVLAIASGVTFLTSETLDFALYTPLRRRFVVAVAVSSVLAAVTDSLLFLYLAHIPYSVALAGQITGKLEVIAVAGLPAALVLRRTVLSPAVAR